MKKFAAILMILILCFSLAACGEPSPSDALKADLENAKASPDEILGDMDDGFGAEATEALIDKVLEFDYELGEEKIDGDVATVELTITTYPFGDMFNSIILDFISEAFANPSMTDEEMNAALDQLLMDALDSADKTYSETVDVELAMVDGAWVVQEGDAWANALTGGMLDFANDANDLFS